MALPYRNWSEEDIKNRNVVEEGDYPFEIISAVLTKSKGGIDKKGQPKQIYDMLELEFNFYDINGVVRKQKDWIVFSDGMDWKLRHLANTTGILNHYEANTLDIHHLAKKQGVFKLGVKDFVGNDGETRKSNFVKDYVKKEVMGIDPSLNDDVPMFS